MAPLLTACLPTYHDTTGGSSTDTFDESTGTTLPTSGADACASHDDIAGGYGFLGVPEDCWEGCSGTSPCVIVDIASGTVVDVTLECTAPEFPTQILVSVTMPTPVVLDAAPGASVELWYQFLPDGDGLAFRISDDSGPLLANATLDYVGPLETTPNILAEAVAPLTSDMQHPSCEGDPLRAAVTVTQADASITLAPDEFSTLSGTHDWLIVLNDASIDDSSMAQSFWLSLVRLKP